MDGKTLIHPSQIDAANRAWTPDEAAVAEARVVVAAFEAPGAADAGVLQIDGRMVERLHLDLARRTLSLAERLCATTIDRGAAASAGAGEGEAGSRDAGTARLVDAGDGPRDGGTGGSSGSGAGGEPGGGGDRESRGP